MNMFLFFFSCLPLISWSALPWDQSKTQLNANERNDNFINFGAGFNPSRLSPKANWTVTYNGKFSQAECNDNEILFAVNLLFCSSRNQVFAIDPATGKTVWQYVALGDFNIQYLSIVGGVRKSTNNHAVAVVGGIQLIVLDAGNGNFLADDTANIKGESLSGVPITTPAGQVYATISVGEPNAIFDFDVNQNNVTSLTEKDIRSSELITLCKGDTLLAVSDYCGKIDVYKIAEQNGKRKFELAWATTPPCGESGYAYTPPVCVTDPLGNHRLVVSAGATQQCRVYEATGGALLSVYPCAFSPMIGYDALGNPRLAVSYSGQTFGGLVVSQIVGNDFIAKELYTVNGIPADSVIAGDYLFTISKVKIPFVVSAVQLTTGKRVWQFVLDQSENIARLTVGGVQGIVKTRFYLVVSTNARLMGFDM